MVCIYKIENTITKKTYVGQTSNYEKRKSSHIKALRDNRHVNKYLQNSWNKYGEKSFEFTIITTCEVEQLNELEILYIRELDTLVPKGYNLTRGGDGVRGLKLSPETLEKMRVITSTLWENEEYRQRQISSHTGLIQSDETKNKRSKSLVGNTNNKRSHRYRCVETGMEYDSIRQIDLGFDFCRTAIHRACVRGIKAYGYHWEFADVLS